MRILLVSSFVTLAATACASFPAAGPLDAAAGGVPLHPRIAGVDSTRPPSSARVDLDRAGYAAVVLVAPGHSATLVYPPDSSTSNRLDAGTHTVRLSIPDMLVRLDTARFGERARRPPLDTTIRNPGRQPIDTTRGRVIRMSPVSPNTTTYLLLVTASQPLVYQKLIEKTAGVSIPTDDFEALNAVGKAIKSTILAEPRDIAGYYQRVELRRGG